jgi:WD40 repeat protein
MGSIVVFDIAAQKQRAVLPTLRPISIPARFNADGRLLAFSDPTGLLDNSVSQQSVRIWDVEAGTYRPSLAGRSLVLGPYTVLRSWWQSSGNKVDFDAASPLAIYGGQFIGDGSLFAAVTGVGERGVTLWNTETGEPVAELPKSFDFAFSADGRLAASQGEDTFLHSPNGVSYAFAKDGSIIAQTAGVPTPASELPKGPRTGTGGLFIQLWSVVAATPTYQKGTEIHTLAFSRDGRMLAASGYPGGQVPSRLWTVTTRDGRLTLHPNKSLSIEGQVFFAGTNQIWEQTTIFTQTTCTTRLRSLMPEQKELSNALLGSNQKPVFSPDGSRAFVATGGHGIQNQQKTATNMTFQIWDVASVKPIKVQPLSTGDAWGWTGCSVFSPDGRRVATSQFVHDGLNMHDAVTLAAQWNSEDVRLKAGQDLRNRLGRLFGEARDEFRSESLVYHIAFTPDSPRVVYLSRHCLIIRDADTGAELGIGCGPNYLEYLQALAVSPDGKFAVTGGVDRMIRVWEIPTARELARWEAHDSDVTALAFSPDGATLASASKQGALKLWHLPALRAELCKLGLDW